MKKDRTLTPLEQKLWKHVTSSDMKPMIAPKIAEPVLKTAKNTPEFDTQTLNKLSEGTLKFSGRIDLHGHTLERAYGELLQYLTEVQMIHGKYVLVITGKGKEQSDYLPDDHRGTLRQMVPRWLAAGEFIALVADVATAAQHHGGEGALYVRLKRL